MPLGVTTTKVPETSPLVNQFTTNTRKEGRRPGWRRDTVRTEHSERSYIIDRRDGVYRRNSAPTPYNT